MSFLFTFVFYQLRKPISLVLAVIVLANIDMRRDLTIRLLRLYYLTFEMVTLRGIL